jgi:hypothetical protein
MGEQIELRCRCGEVRGMATDLSPRSVNRIVCYCDDCQAFAHQIGRADLLDPQGGSDIVQLAPAAMSFTQGQHRIVGLQLKAGGLYRWYASCCNTPFGNTLTPRIPFVGLLAPAFDKAKWDDAVGKPSGAIFGKFAVGEPPSGSTGLNLLLLLRALGRLFQGAGLAASVFLARDRRAALCGDGAVGGATRGAARVMRPASGRALA